jgi:hypothetical protein
MISVAGRRDPLPGADEASFVDGAVLGVDGGQIAGSW